jgi:uncharacterized protein (DUF486 family)
VDVSTLRFGREIRWLYQAALLMFLITIGLGMSRGLGLVSFADRNILLTHLHSGTIGWITLGILATVLWLYSGTAARRPADARMGWLAAWLAFAVPLYIVAWWSGNFPFRAVAGALVLIGILAYVVWLVIEAARIGYGRLSVPQLGTVVGLVTLVFGSALGVYLQVQFATVTNLSPDIGNLIGSHAETQVSAYLVLVAMSIAYWRLVPERPGRARRGTWMVWLLFVGGAIIAIALITNTVQATVAYIPLDIAAFVLFLTLAWRQVLAPGWFTAGSARHYAVAIPFALVYLAIFIALIVGFAVLQVWKDFTEIPPNLIPASEHPLFVGMVTNTIFGLLFDLNRDRRGIWPWADHAVFWGITIAVAAFTAAILLSATQLYAFITPVLGLSILVGILTHTRRLWSRPTPEPTI